MAALAAGDKKASEIVILDVSRTSGVTDFLVIGTADSERQVLAVTDHIDKALTEKGHRLFGLEGTESGIWVLMDFGDVVVHIFKRSAREHYGLDRLWSDAKPVSLTPAQKAVPLGRTQPRPGQARTLRQRG